MNLDARKLATALAAVTALLWISCSAAVALLADPMMSMTGHMVHMDTSAFSWQLTWPGFFLGLIAWTLLAAVTGWLIAWFYNR